MATSAIQGGHQLEVQVSFPACVNKILSFPSGPSRGRGRTGSLSATLRPAGPPVPLRRFWWQCTRSVRQLKLEIQVRDPAAARPVRTGTGTRAVTTRACAGHWHTQAASNGYPLSIMMSRRLGSLRCASATMTRPASEYAAQRSSLSNSPCPLGRAGGG